MSYDFKIIEEKWREKWRASEVYKTAQFSEKPKYYILVEFPYPSGNGLHVGHARPYTAMDVLARKRRAQGYNVLFPMGWDAFGLPTENFAIQNKIHPAEVTRNNVKKFKNQVEMLGYSLDFSREINTTDPSYYKWTQWIFLKLFEKGLAYKAKMPVNFCTSCKCVLANEEVVDGVCERCGSLVVRRDKSQWMLKITEYAERLLSDLDTVDYPERVKTQQRNWIGRSTGAEVIFKATSGDDIKIFTTRPDTLFGATYMVISPEHELVSKWFSIIKNRDEVEAYRKTAASKSDFERTEMQKDKTGVKLQGVSAINPVTGEEIPVFISDYVLVSYGTGAIMAVPGHDQRDWEFARKFDLPVIEVVSGGNIEESAFTDTEDGVMVNSGFLNGMRVAGAKETITAWLEDKKLGIPKVNYRLRDWVFSRQRYWGEPIPIINCPSCGYVPLEEKDLPLVLPEVESYETTDTGESPIALIRDWVNTTCPKCGGKAERETDTMPQWAGSSWYFLRYADPDNNNELISKKAEKYWLPVDWYNGGMEHTTLHLLYSRFWHKFLYDIGVVSTPEPYKKRTCHGMILGEDGEKMSKSRGNVINPNDICNEYGADTMRLYIMFIGDFEKAASWQANAVRGCKRFLDRVWSMAEKIDKQNSAFSSKNEGAVNRTIKKVGEDIDSLKFNTAVASLMALLNDFSANGASLGDFSILLRLLFPFAPYITEQLWEDLGNEGMLSAQPWPEYDEDKCREENIDIAIQINGKLRSAINIPRDSSDETVFELAKNDPKTAKYLADMNIVKVIVVKNKIINIIIKP